MVEVMLARSGKLLLEPTYEMVVKHGSAFDSFQAYDRGGIGATRADLGSTLRINE
jgi:hypothetical protein